MEIVFAMSLVKRNIEGPGRIGYGCSMETLVSLVL